MSLEQARATVTLVGLGAGDVAWVDTADPQIARWLRGGQLRLLNEEPFAKPPVASISEPEVEAEGSPEVTPASVETAKPKPKRAPARKVTK